MNKNGPLLLVDDDADDREMIGIALEELAWDKPVRFFKDAESALQYLQQATECPFLIISDLNMPKMTGLDFKAHIETNNILQRKNIPFVFLSTTTNRTFVSKAFQLNAKGFFVKGPSYSSLKTSLKTILSYWAESEHAN